MNNVEQALEDLKNGKLIVLLDDLDRENEGDLVGIAQFLTVESINFMITHAKGLLCAPISKKIATTHNLPLVPKRKSDGTNFLYSIDAPFASTGISAFERMDALNSLLNDKLSSFKSPGHLFPLLAREGGLSKRRGHTEATVDLAKIINAKEVGAIIEIIGDDGQMLRGDALLDFAKKHHLTFLTIDQLSSWIAKNKPEIWQVKDHQNDFIFSATALLPSRKQKFKIAVAKEITTNQDITLVWHGNLKTMKNPFVRIHSQCITSEIFGSLKCDCKNQLDHAFELIAQNEGLIIYTPDEGRGIGIFEKINSYHMQDQGLNTLEADRIRGFDADHRDLTLGARILKQLGFKKVKLLTNNPDKIANVEAVNIEVTREPLWVDIDDHARNYIETKVKEMGHIK